MPNHETPAPADQVVFNARPVLPPPHEPRRVMTLPLLDRRAAGLDLALVSAVTLIYPLLSVLVVSRWAATDFVAPAALLTLSKWLEAGLATGLAAYLVLRHRLSWRAFGFAPISPWPALGWTLATYAAVIAALLASAMIVLPLALLSPELRDETLAQRVEFAKALPINNLSQSIWLLLAVAVHEEVLFRGILLPYLRRLVGRWWLAVLISSAVFGSLHVAQGALAMIQTSLLGVALALGYLGARNLIPVIVAHFVFNLVQFQLIARLPELMRWYEQAHAASSSA